MEMDNFKENIVLTSGKFKEEKEYWLDKLKGDFTISGFPTDFKQDDLYQHKKSIFNCKLTETVSNGLVRISNNSEYGLYLILLCGIKYLLFRYTGNEDIVAGMPVFRLDETEHINGSGTFALRTKFNNRWRFKDLLLEVKKTVDEARKYMNIPFEMIADLLELKFDGGVLPKIKTLIVMKNIQHISVETQKEADVIFSFLKTDKFIALDIEYDSGLYAPGTMERLGDHLNNFYREVLENSDRDLSELNVFSETERNQVLFDFNNTAVDFQKDKTIQELFEEQVNKTPNKVALVFKDQTLTYRELNERSNQIARLLRKKGIKEESIVGIMVERSFDMIAGIFGVLKAGGAYLPIDPDYPGERIKYMLNDSGADILLTKNRFIHYVNFEKESVYLDDENISEVDTSNTDVANTSENLAYVVYTSGSTGEPKGAAIKHRAVVNFIKGITDRIEFKPENTILALTTICFDIFVLESLLPLTQGLKVVIADEADQRDPRMLNSLIMNEGIDMLQVTASRMQLLLSYGEKLTCMDRIKVFMVGGEVFPQALLKSIRELSRAKIYNMYGPIETTIWSTVKEVEPEGELNIGKPIANTRVYITGSNNSLQIVGIPGESCIAGEGLARGYINKPELTAMKFISNPFSDKAKDSLEEDRLYCTGDLAKWLPNGDIEFLGRADYQVKIRGFRIEPGEIESLLLKYEGIIDAAVVDKTDHDGNKYLCAYVVIEEGLNFIELKDFLSKNLPYYMIPTHYRKLDNMPLTLNGKTDRRVLRKLEDMAVKTVYVAPRNDLESKLVEIWQEVLKVEKVGIDDDIEELGGNSFLAMRLELTMEMNDLEVTNIEIFQNRSIRKLAEHIEKKLNEAATQAQFEAAATQAQVEAATQAQAEAATAQAEAAATQAQAEATGTQIQS